MLCVLISGLRDDGVGRGQPVCGAFLRVLLNPHQPSLWSVSGHCAMLLRGACAFELENYAMAVVYEARSAPRCVVAPEPVVIFQRDRVGLRYVKRPAATSPLVPTSPMAGVFLLICGRCCVYICVGHRWGDAHVNVEASST